MFFVVQKVGFYLLSLCDIISGMEKSQTQRIIISAVVIAILFGGYVYFDRKNKEGVNNLANQATTTGSTINTQTSTGGYTIEQVPVDQNQAPEGMPDLNRPVTSPSSVSVSIDALVLATQKILALQAQLKKTPTDFNSWLDLGMYQKMAGDYDGAVLSWQYASKIIPSSPTPLGNLGNLYAYFIKDNVKAEMYYKEALAQDPSQEYLYTQLAEFYRDILKDFTKAGAIVSAGLARIPNDPNLLQIRDSLK